MMNEPLVTDCRKSAGRTLPTFLASVVLIVRAGIPTTFLAVIGMIVLTSTVFAADVNLFSASFTGQANGSVPVADTGTLSIIVNPTGTTENTIDVQFGAIRIRKGSPHIAGNSPKFSGVPVSPLTFGTHTFSFDWTLVSENRGHGFVAVVGEGGYSATTINILNTGFAVQHSSGIAYVPDISAVTGNTYRITVTADIGAKTFTVMITDLTTLATFTSPVLGWQYATPTQINRLFFEIGGSTSAEGEEYRFDNIAIQSADSDEDGIADVADNCPTVSNPDQTNTDSDALGNACDPDIDNDGVLNAGDNCPAVSNPDQADGDGDGAGNACDADGDNDGIPDVTDQCGNTPAGQPVDGNGCSIDQLCPCVRPLPAVWKNRGAYVSCVAKQASRFEELGLIADVGEVVASRARSACGK